MLHLQFPTTAEITPAQNLEMSEDLTVFMSLGDKYGDIVAKGRADFPLLAEATRIWH